MYSINIPNEYRTEKILPVNDVALKKNEAHIKIPFK